MSSALDYLLEVVEKVKSRQVEASTQASQTPRYILCLAGELTFLLDVSVISKVLEPGLVSEIPNTQPWVLGVSHYQDSLLPIIDLSLWLGCEQRKEDFDNKPSPVRERWLLLEQAGAPFIFSIYAYDGLVQLDDFKPVDDADLPHNCKGFVTLKSQYKGQDCYLLELKNMLDAKETLSLFVDGS